MHGLFRLSACVMQRRVVCFSLRASLIKHQQRAQRRSLKREMERKICYHQRLPAAAAAAACMRESCSERTQRRKN